MKVNLISIPDNIIRIIYTACRTCYSAETPFEIWNESLNPSKILNLITKVLKSGHHSTIEHINFIFTVEGISRACSHQLVRHRHCSFSQQSMRYVEFDFESAITTIANENNENNDKEFINIIKQYYVINDDITKNQLNFYISSLFAYNQIIKNGVKPEDARGILGQNFKTNLVMTCNLRQLIHIANERLCVNAQAEIRELVKNMCDLIIEKEPWLSEYLVPKCEVNNYCNEIKKCGKY